ncbi:MAG: hypothetical protein ABFS37_10005 [Acidobacteriota bacterium]
MRTSPLVAVCAYILVSSALSFAQPAPPPSLMKADGVRIDWNDWLTEHGSSAVVLWASWLPEDQKDVKRLAEIRRVAADKDLGFVVIALQEPISASRDGLGSTELQWLHDRHGAMLKHLLVYRIPSLAVIHHDGTVLARLKPDPKALIGWGSLK